MSVSDYIKQLQSYEEYTFSLTELYENSNAPETTLKKELIRLVEKNEIIKLRHSLFCTKGLFPFSILFWKASMILGGCA